MGGDSLDICVDWQVLKESCPMWTGGGVASEAGWDSKKVFELKRLYMLLQVTAPEVPIGTQPREVPLISWLRS